MSAHPEPAAWRPGCGIAALAARAAALAAVRRFFAERQVLEVQTPILGRATVTDTAIASFAAADPARYLQTSPEYHMKRLLAAGAPSIYQLGPVFRRGEQGRWHNPEFTLLEWYRLGFDAARLMDEVEALVDLLLGPGAYRRCTYAELFRDCFDVDAGDGARLQRRARDLGLAAATPEDAADLLFAQALQAQGGRIFVTDFPAPLAALARIAPNGTAARFELAVDGIEIANGYHELLDAGELAARMARDAATRRRRSLPVIEPDHALLAAMRHGLPDCAGVAVGFDRLLALKLGARSIGEVMAFAWERA